MNASIPMREACGMCHDVSVIGFHVPDQTWREVIHPRYRESVVCLRCFARRADEKLVAWDVEIDFYPQSLRTHLEDIGALSGAAKERP